MFAPSRLYGLPDAFRHFVDQAHGTGLGVILDVVYNHLGPDGNYLWQFARDYFSTNYHSEWGDAINFDGPNSGPVREYFLANVAYWIQEFHLDGLRIDATQQIFDSSEQHILAAITRKVRETAHPHSTLIVGENEPQKAVYFLPYDKGGYDIDTMWNDDFHHSAMVALTGRADAYYTDYRGTAQNSSHPSNGGTYTKDSGTRARSNHVARQRSTCLPGNSSTFSRITISWPIQEVANGSTN